MEVSLEESLQNVNDLRDHYVSELADGLTVEEYTEFKSRIWNQFAGARLHVRVIYEAEYSLGPNLSGLLEFSTSNNYKVNLENLTMHLEDGPDQVKQSGFLSTQEGEAREFRRYIASISQYVRRQG